MLLSCLVSLKSWAEDRLGLLDIPLFQILPASKFQRLYRQKWSVPAHEDEHQSIMNNEYEIYSLKGIKVASGFYIYEERPLQYGILFW